MGGWAFEKGCLSLTWHQVACECDVSGIMLEVMPNLGLAEVLGVSEVKWPEIEIPTLICLQKPWERSKGTGHTFPCPSPCQGDSRFGLVDVPKRKISIAQKED